MFAAMFEQGLFRSYPASAELPGCNFLWSILFFVCRSPLLGLIGIVVLDALAMVYIARSYRIRRDAAWMFAPYLAWILYATYLNGWILAANGPGI